MHIYKWDKWAQANVPVPMVTGHEYGGEVVEIGSTVRRVQVGQRVSGEGHVVGNVSRNARSGRWHLDPDTKGIGVNLPGAFAEYIRLPEFNVIPLPDDLSMDIAAILDPLGNAVHTALTFDLVGEDVLITGEQINPAIHTVNVLNESLTDKMKEIGIKEGFDVGFEMSGAEPAFSQMVDTMIMGGNIAMLGLPPEPFPVDLGKIALKALTLRGIYGRQM